MEIGVGGWQKCQKMQVPYKIHLQKKRVNPDPKVKTLGYESTRIDLSSGPDLRHSRAFGVPGSKRVRVH